uniref:Secreted protein n=1 Tax=Ascaris lumbricoides TaxID=6252 RepID=A0A0M3ITQ6_ASCLU
MYFGAVLCVLLATSFACPPETSTNPPSAAMYFGAVLCVLLATSFACPPETSTTPPSTGAPDGRSLKKRSVGCNPDEVLVEAITKVPFGEQDVNEKTDRAVRAKVRRALVITLLSILSCVLTVKSFPKSAF